MSVLSAIEARDRGIPYPNDAVRHSPWCYWYVTTTHQWVYAGPPDSPRSVMDR